MLRAQRLFPRPLSILTDNFVFQIFVSALERRCRAEM
jgi:hypothetical protein